ncbi:MAG: DivIVA domain-containing protein [Clostridia bacterium]|nr:DivIVA domain-containing protein [Oscillospiraceae bacterium]MBQ7033004.1 DivIVA domain-containing protein [Clostridia bacterium]
MFTPLELEKIEFSGAFMGGYKKEDVEEVFNELTADYETLYKENIANKDKLQMLQGLVDKYKAMEDSLQNALLLAQTSSDAAIRAAQDKAANIIKEAEEKAAYIVREAEDSIKAVAQQEQDLKRNISVFAARNISQLRTQIEIINGMVQDANEAPASYVPTPPVSAPVAETAIPAPSPMSDTQVAAPIVPPAMETEN